MKYHVYILYSEKLNRFYVGHTKDLSNRILEHNSGETLYTSQGKPWSLIWSTTKSSLRQAEALEFKIKNLSKTRKIKFIKKYSEGISDIELFHYIEHDLD